MKTKCITNRSGYEHCLKIGEYYEIINICNGMFPGDHYITVKLENGKTASALRHRFDITKEQCNEFMRDNKQ